ncbi:MAG: extracellular solute-binding protein [Chloroflexi bacterium]|nr:extracellular solute-binding protein [Chloroflexota bacterium]
MTRSLWATRLGSLALMMVLALGACAAPGAKETPPPAATKSSQAAGGQPWEGQWQDVLAAAKKEGRVSVYTANGVWVREALESRFSERYRIELDFLTARGAELTAKIDTERRAGLHVPDLYVGGSTAPLTQLKPKGYLDEIEPLLLLPEVTSPAAWFGNGVNYVEKDRMIVAFVATTVHPVALNSDLVRPGEIKSYTDLLQPRWKGKLLLTDMTIDGPGLDWYSSSRQMGLDLDFMRRLVMQEPVIIRDHRVNVEWLARGKYPVFIGPHDATLTEFKDAGAPVTQLVPVEGTWLKSGGGSVSLMNRAPHPNAARVFINWLLTREAQVLYQKGSGQQSARLDVPPEPLAPDKVRQDGVKYFNAGSEESQLAREGFVKEAREVFVKLLK